MAEQGGGVPPPTPDILSDFITPAETQELLELSQQEILEGGNAERFLVLRMKYAISELQKNQAEIIGNLDTTQTALRSLDAKLDTELGGLATEFKSLAQFLTQKDRTETVKTTEQIEKQSTEEEQKQAQKLDKSKGASQSQLFEQGSKQGDLQTWVKTLLLTPEKKGGMVEFPEPILPLVSTLPAEADKRFTASLKSGMIKEGQEHLSRNSAVFRELKSLSEEFHLDSTLTIKLYKRATSGTLFELIMNLSEGPMANSEIWERVQQHATRPITPSEAEAEIQTRIFEPKGSLADNVLFIYNKTCQSVPEIDKDKKTQAIEQKAKNNLSLLLSLTLPERDIKAINNDVSLHMRATGGVDELTFWEYTQKVYRHVKAERQLTKKGGSHQPSYSRPVSSTYQNRQQKSEFRDYSQDRRNGNQGYQGSRGYQPRPRGMNGGYQPRPRDSPNEYPIRSNGYRNDGQQFRSGGAYGGFSTQPQGTNYRELRNDRQGDYRTALRNDIRNTGQEPRIQI